MASEGPANLSTCIHFEYEEIERATKGLNKKKVSEGGCKLGEVDSVQHSVGIYATLKWPLKCADHHRW